LALSGSKRGPGLRELDGQGARLLRDAGAIELNGLELYEVFNQGLHQWLKVYGIGPVVRSGPGTRNSRRLREMHTNRR
jgi:hypothetical protein